MAKQEDILDAIQGMGINIDTAHLKVDAPLVNQGLDSLDMATLMLELEGKFGKPMAPENTAKLRTIAQILDYLNR